MSFSLLIYIYSCAKKIKREKNLNVFVLSSSSLSVAHLRWAVCANFICQEWKHIIFKWQFEWQSFQLRWRNVMRTQLFPQWLQHLFVAVIAERWFNIHRVFTSLSGPASPWISLSRSNLQWLHPLNPFVDLTFHSLPDSFPDLTFYFHFVFLFLWPVHPARGADQCPGDLQHCLHQHVHPGDDPKADCFWFLWVPEEPL